MVIVPGGTSCQLGAQTIAELLGLRLQPSDLAESIDSPGLRPTEGDLIKSNGFKNAVKKCVV